MKTFFVILNFFGSGPNCVKLIYVQTDILAVTVLNTLCMDLLTYTYSEDM